MQELAIDCFKCRPNNVVSLSPFYLFLELPIASDTRVLIEKFLLKITDKENVSRFPRWLRWLRRESVAIKFCRIEWRFRGWGTMTSVTSPCQQFRWWTRTPKTVRISSLGRLVNIVFVSLWHLHCSSSKIFLAASVSRIAKYFYNDGMNIITAGGFSYDFEEKKTNCGDQFHMLTRAGVMSFERIASFTAHLMKNFNWKRAAFVYDRNGYKEVGGSQTCHL